MSTFFRALALFASACMWMVTRPGTVYAEAATQPTVASIAVSDSDRAIVDSVEGLGVPVTRRQVADGATDVDLLLWARTLPEPLVLWVDSRTSTVSVLRKSDGTSLSRVLGQQTFTESPYVAALAATELLELMGNTPPAQVETAPVLPEPEPVIARPSMSWLGSVGGQLTASPQRGPSLMRPLLGVGTAFFLNAQAFVYGELSAMPYGVAVQSLPARNGGRVRYERSDLALRAGAGIERGAASVLGYLSPGVGFLRVKPVGVDDDRARTRRRKQTIAGGGAVFRYWLGEYVGLAFGIDVAWLTSPVRYLVDGQLVLEEDSLRIGASLSVVGRIR